MFAAAADKAKSLEPVKIALALEGMEFEVFNGGTGYMRKDDHQFFQPMYSVVRRIDQRRAVRRGKYWLGLEGREDRDCANRPADHLQDDPAELIVGVFKRSDG